ncbi:metallophosphoesterase [Gracilibacillus phocaeensis]|nr:metallophosphoesterase [Gracilibacillus phocaeensis]
MLIVLGGLIDRGPDSLHVIHTLMDLQTHYPDRVIILKGNHDESSKRLLFQLIKKTIRKEETSGIYGYIIHYTPSEYRTERDV